MKERVLGFWLLFCGGICSVWYAACTNSTTRTLPVIRYLTKVGEIEKGFSSEGENYFWKISSLCCDRENRLFVSDSGWNKIFVFDSMGKFLRSIGRAGQGPGEFMANPKSNALKINLGNNGKLCVLDSDSSRFSVFDQNLALEKTYVLNSQGPRIFDTPQVNLNGEVFLVSYFQEHLIQCFNKQMQWQRGVLEGKYHFPPSLRDKSTEPARLFSNEHHLQKVLTKDDRLYVLSNFALRVYGFDERLRQTSEIDLRKNYLFFENYQRRIRAAKGRKGYLLPFVMFLDQYENLSLGYYNEDYHNWEIYIYSQTGEFKEILRIREKVYPPIRVDSSGIFYMADEERIRIMKYKIKEES